MVAYLYLDFFRVLGIYVFKIFFIKNPILTFRAAPIKRSPRHLVTSKLKVHFYVYNNPSSIDNRKDDILYWPSKKDSIDISDYLIEILLVEVPFKKLCSTDCKGICIKCGSNRNDESCLCEKNK